MTMGGRTDYTVKPVVLDFKTKDGTKCTKALTIYGTIKAAAVARGKMMKISHDKTLRNECDLGEGIS